MKIGMLWYDRNPKTSFVEKCNRAIKYYTEKYGMRPTAIWVNPKTAITKIPGIAIVQSRSILTNHFWVGCED
jgi:hypothetical protein